MHGSLWLCAEVHAIQQLRSQVRDAHAQAAVAAVDGAGLVALAGHVLGQQDVAGLELASRAVAADDLHLSFEDDEVLSAGWGMPIAEAVLGGAAEDEVFAGLGGDAQHVVAGHTQIVEVRLTIVAGVDAYQHSCLHVRIGAPLRAPTQV